MKRLFSALLCLALITGSAACSDDETTRPVLVVNAGESFLSLDALARAGKISVTSSLPWRVTAAAGDKWFTLSATEGPAGYSEIEVTFDRNEGPARSAQLAFASEDLIVPFVMSQSAPKDGYDAPDYYFYAGFGTMPPSMPDCMCCPTTNRVISIIRVRERSTRISSRRMSKSRRRPTGPRMPPKPKRTRCAAK